MAIFSPQRPRFDHHQKGQDMTPAESNLLDIARSFTTLPAKVAAAAAAPARIVKTVPCPRCNGEGTTAGAMSYGSNIENCETCRRCGGRCVVDMEISA
jgi:DnaJ-class molecular chaperone